MEEKKIETSNFIKDIINSDLAVNKNNGKVVTRFPPEPNGYLHIGHAKSICINFGTAKLYKGKTHLRFDDTNPEKEDVEYVDSIMEDVKWLGFDWGTNLFYASDYYQALYDSAVKLIKIGKAYVCNLTFDEMRAHRGTLTEAGKNSPYRDRSVEENIALFEKMKNGEFKDGECVLRAKIDMTSPNINMRDPVVYRIKRAHHHRTGDQWCIYPMYDFAHCISDSIEGITHSICTLEFEDHRPLYDWFLDVLVAPCHPQQIEFARLNLTYTVMSKRKLKELVDNKIVSGWDDPRMPTICGLRRRGFTAQAIRNFAEAIGVSKANSTVDYEYLEYFVREDLNESAPRVMAVIEPLKVTITNYPADLEEEVEISNHPKKPEMGTHKAKFTKTLYIEKEDFKEVPPPKYFRLSLGKEVRLQGGYFITCTDIIKDPATGEVTEILCTYDPATKGGNAPDGRKVKGTLHWVSEKYSVKAKINLYDNLFAKPNPDVTEEGKNYLDNMNPASLKTVDSFVEQHLLTFNTGDKFQFIRNGYFCLDKSSTKDNMIFNRTVTLKDTWSKIGQ